MENDDKIKIVEWLLFFYLILFPFGQIIRWQLTFGEISFALHPTDAVVVMIFLCTLAFGLTKPRVFKLAENFLLAASFSLILSIFIFRSGLVVLGAFYLLRIYAYSYLFVAAWNIFRGEKLKETLLTSLIGISLAMAVFGWFQYFVYPDFRPLVEWGWDDHLYRLVSTLLDPAFTSIILVFGYVLSLTKYLVSQKRGYLGLAIFFLITTAFTYSRAGYLAIVVGSVAVLLAFKKLKKVLILIFGLLLIVFLLPRPSGEGVKLERLRSIYARGTNYLETLKIASKAPLFGVGFNNLCLARQQYLGRADARSHACSGSDSSLLFILATTGIIGLVIFLTGLYQVVKFLPKDIYGISALGAVAGLGIHGFFSNSYFYPWVMGYMALLLALGINRN